MGHCCSKNVAVSVVKDDTAGAGNRAPPAPLPEVRSSEETPAHSSVSPWQSQYPAGVAPSPSPSMTPKRKFKWPFPPPSPAKPIMAFILKRQGTKRSKEGTINEDEGEGGAPLDKTFGYPKNFRAKYELGKEVGRGHFGHTCWAKGKKGQLKNQTVAVKIISKAKVCGMSS